MTGAVVDFPPLPEGVTSDDMVDVFREEGPRTDWTRGPQFFFGLYR